MADRTQRSPRIVLLGASPTTGNLGVTALCVTTMAGLAKRGITDQVVFDFAHGNRPFPDEELPPGQYRLVGSSNTRRYYRANNLKRQWFLASRWPFTNPALRAIRRADVVLSIAGGDSFTDLYGEQRFETSTLAKRIALKFKKPLVLLPQTYGPFRDVNLTPIATQIIRQAKLAYARDPASYELLRSLADESFDESRYRLGVDMAFSLPVREPDMAQRERVEALIHRPRAGPVVGINVSGLLYNDPKQAHQQYGLQADYEQVVLELVCRLLSATRSTILLVPHVVTPPHHFESDIRACRQLREVVCNKLVGQGIRGEEADRLFIADAFDHPSKAKWLVGQCHWFCGARMHSTIAGLSQGIATTAIAYSKKTLGVFAQCGVEDQVVDPRTTDTATVIETLWQSWTERETMQQRLAEHLPAVLQRSEQQLDEIAEFCFQHQPER